MKFDISTTFEQFLEHCTIDYSLTIDTIYKNYLATLELANEEAKRDQVIPKNATIYETLFANLTKYEPNSFFFKPFDNICKEVTYYKNDEARNEYLRGVIFRLRNRNNNFDASENQNELTQKDILLKTILSDYQKGFCPPLNFYKALVNNYLNSEFNSGYGFSNPRPRESQFKNLPQRDLNEHCSLICEELLDDISLAINDFEIEKYCNFLMSEGTEKNTIVTPETFEDVENGGGTSKKLTWKGTPSQFGFIFQELCQKGYIELPKISKKRQAKLLFEMFDFNSTIGTIENEIGMSNSLTVDKQKKFKIPPQDEV